MKIQFEFQDGDAKAIQFLSALLAAMQAEPRPEPKHEEQDSGKQEPESAAQDADDSDPAPTKDEAFSALRAYISDNGGEAAKALLAEFGVARFGELAEEHYAALIARIGAP